MRFYANFSWTEVVSVRGHRCWEIGWWKQWTPCFFVGLFEENQSFWWFLPRKPGILQLSFSHFTACLGWFKICRSWFFFNFSVSAVALILIQGSKALPMRMVDGVAAPVIEVPCHWGRKMGEIHKWHQMAMKKWRTWWSSGGNMWESGAVNHVDPENGTMKCMKHDNTLWLVLTRRGMSRRSLG